MSERMIKLTEDAAVEAVTASIRRLFTTATDRQVRDLARAVLRDLAAQGFWLSEPVAEDGSA